VCACVALFVASTVIQVMWPDHCVEDSIGADFHPYLARFVFNSPCGSSQASLEHAPLSFGQLTANSSRPFFVCVCVCGGCDSHGSDVVVRMGTNPKADSYSAFGDAFGGKYERTELADVLRKAAIEHVRSCPATTWLAECA